METFVVRVFAAVGGEPLTPLRGLVEHVGSGSRDPFESPERLISLLESMLARRCDRDAADRESKGGVA